MSRDTLPEWMHAFDAELSVIGAAFLDPSAVVRSGCMPEHFAWPRHRIVWSAIQSVLTAGEPVDTVTVTTRLEAWGKVEDAGGPEHLADLAEAAATAGNVEYHGGIVRDLADARRAVRLINSMGPAVLRAIEQGSADGSVRAGIRRALSTVANEAVALMTEATQAHEWIDMVRAKRQAVERIQGRYEAWQAGGAPADLLPTGIEALDATVGGGLEMGHVCVVDGASGAGKTALMLRMARAFAEHLHSVDPDPAVSGVVVYYSCEVGAADLAIRDLACASGIDGVDLRSGRLASYGAIDRLLEKAKPAAGDRHLRIGFRPAAPVEWIIAEVRLIEEQVGPVRAVIVDHWNEVTTQRRGLRSDEREAAHILTQLDQLKAPTARAAHGRCVVVGAQHTADGSRLLWGNALKQKASYAWTWQTPGKGLPDDADPSSANVKRWKMRNGPLGDTPLRWHAPTGRIESPRA